MLLKMKKKAKNIHSIVVELEIFFRMHIVY